MKIIKLIALVIVLVPLISLSQTNKNSSFIITGELKNIKVPISAVYIKSMEENDNNYRANVKNGKYVIKGNIDGPTKMNILPLYPKGTDRTKLNDPILFVYIEPGNIHITHSGSFANMTIKGSKTQEAFNELNALVKAKKNEDQMSPEIKEVYRNFVRNNPQSSIAVYALKAYAESGDPNGGLSFPLEELPLNIKEIYLQRINKINLDTIVPLFQNLPSGIRKSKAAIELNIEIEFAKVAALQAPYFVALDSLATQYVQASKDKQESQRKAIEIKMDSIRLLVYENVYAPFIKINPNSPVAISVLKWYAGSNFTDPAKTLVLYNLVSDSSKETGEGKEFAARLSTAMKTGIRQTAPDFTETDTAGKPVSLSSFRGKYVLLDFWASWCVPCIKELPYIVKTYQQYWDKGFTVLSVSLDTDKAKWLDAINKDGLTWTHVSDLKEKNYVVELYDILGIPANLLIDPNGKVVAKNLTGATLYDKVSQILQ